MHYDHDLGPILIQDCKAHTVSVDVLRVLISIDFHTPYRELTTRSKSRQDPVLFVVLTKTQVMSTNLNEIFQSTDNTLINGKMPYNCSLAAPGSDCKPNAQFSIFQVEAGKTYKLRVINSGAGSYLGFSIDNHELTIISNDFTPLVPYQTTMARLSVSVRWIPTFLESMLTVSQAWSKIGHSFHSEGGRIGLDARAITWKLRVSIVQRSRSSRCSRQRCFGIHGTYIDSMASTFRQRTVCQCRQPSPWPI